MLTKQPPGPKSAASSDSTSSSSKKSDSNYCLWCWTIICVFCGFLAAVFIATVFLSLIVSFMEPVMEPQCEKIERQLSMTILPLGVMFQPRLLSIIKMKLVQY
jgi:hypothetical protein